MTEVPRTLGPLLGSTVEDIVGTIWILGHDLKSPISIIISTLEMLVSLHEDDPKMAQTVHLLRGALAAANRQYNMVSDVLDLARLELGQYDLDLQFVDLASLIREVLEDESYALESKKLDLSVNFPDGADLPAEIDSALMKRVISALVDNAIKFTVRGDMLAIKGWIEDHKINVSFADTGRPIFSEFEQQILIRPPQWENRQAGSRTSVGMGLPFIHAVMRAHGGSFRAHSDPDSKITSFVFTLPMRSDPSDEDTNPGN